MKESDLYPPVKTFLETQGYEVKGEVQDCDVVAVRDDESPVVVELKLNLNLDLLLQGVDRVNVSSKIYIGVPETCRILKKRRKLVRKLLRMLGLGLLAINPEKGRVTVLLDPGEYKPRTSKHKKDRLLGEFHNRVGDPNPGGSAMRKGIMTVYRQRALAIASYLEQHGPTKASDIAKAINEPKARDILYQDFYGWFERPERAIYNISPRGKNEIPLWKNNRKA